MASKNEGKYDSHLVVCHGCAAIDAKRKELESADYIEPGLRISVTKQ